MCNPFHCAVETAALSWDLTFTMDVLKASWYKMYGRYKMLWKSPNELFGQPNNWHAWGLLPCGWAVMNRIWSFPSSIPSPTLRWTAAAAACTSSLKVICEREQSATLITKSWAGRWSPFLTDFFSLLSHFVFSLFPSSHCDCTPIKVLAYKHIIHCAFFFFFPQNQFSREPGLTRSQGGNDIFKLLENMAIVKL